MEKWFTREGTEYAKKVARDDKGRPFFARLRICDRCGGRGGWEGWPDFTCYKCGGTCDLGYERVRVFTEAELAKLNATRDKRRAKAKRLAKVAAFEAEAAAKLAGFTAANAELVAKARANVAASPILTDLVAKLDKYGNWSEKQIALVAKLVAEIADTAAKRAASGYVGEVGKRIEAKVTVERVASYTRESLYSRGPETVWILTMRDEAGNAIVSKTPRFHGEKGESFTLRATVKEHSEYNGEKQTVVMRAAKIEEKVTS